MITQNTTVVFCRYINGERHQYLVRGRIAQTLYHLVQASERGITALEVSTWALRLAAYVCILRHDYGLDIVTLREPHEGGSHARYVLHTPVEILELFDAVKTA
jgi:hypothetical protein